MATTGFWPVKDRLKEVIDYAENPDKTIDKKYVDSDLYAALRYVQTIKRQMSVCMSAASTATQSGRMSV